MLEADLWRALLLSLIPGLFWLAYLRSLSRRATIPIWLWIWALFLGWASTQLTLWLSKTLKVEALQSVPWLGLFLYFVLGVGLVEEFAKALCALAGLSLLGSTREPLVTLQLSGAVALGFATTENVLYVSHHGEQVLVGRFLFATLGHVLFASVWGLALASDPKGGGRRRWGLLLNGLLLSSLAHGLYDWFLVSGRPVLAVLTLGLLWFGFRQATLEAFLRQEYERELPYETRECGACRVLTRAEGAFCSFCGAPHRSEQELDGLTCSSPPGA